MAVGAATGPATLAIAGSGRPDLDPSWAMRVLGVGAVMPRFRDARLRSLAAAHAGMKPWAAGSLFEGLISSLVGQSISVAAAAVTERRLYARFGEPIVIGDRPFWAPPLAEQLAEARVEFVRASGVTTRRAEALVEVGRRFAEGRLREPRGAGRDDIAETLLTISGIGHWTVRSALLWGLGDADAYPSGDVALLRAVRRRRPRVATFRDLDAAAAAWAPHRGWAARLYWLDLLGYDAGGSVGVTRHIPGD